MWITIHFFFSSSTTDTNLNAFSVWACLSWGPEKTLPWSFPSQSPSPARRIVFAFQRRGSPKIVQEIGCDTSLRLSTLTSKCATSCWWPQNPPAWMASRALSAIMADADWNRSPQTGCWWGSAMSLLQVSDSRPVRRSLTSLWRGDT